MSERRIVTSWKEIAAYLKVRVRTAQRWEKELGLPVHRMNKLDKAYVFAYTDELDKWFEKRIRSRNILKRFYGINKPLSLIGFSFIFLIVFIFVLIVFIYLPSHKDLIPSEFEVTNSRLIIYNSAGQELWSYELKESLDYSAYKRKELPASGLSSRSNLNVCFKDIDQDEKINVIFGVQTKNESGEKVLCFDERGKLIWSFIPGRSIRFGDYLISEDFCVRLLRVVDLNQDGYLEILIIANHKIHFPTRVVVLDYQGKIMGEYWNVGHLNCVEIVDLDGDGLQEIILGGVNNSYRRACVLVLDIRKMSGCSPRNNDPCFICSELDRGTEKYYLLIPPNKLGRLLYLYETVESIDLFENNRLQICTNFSRIIYEFNYQLETTYVYLSDELIFKYEQLRREGKIKEPLDSLDTKQLLNDVLYWDGGKWQKQATLNKYWQRGASFWREGKRGRFLGKIDKF